MTGNTVKLGISMQQGQWQWTGVYFLCVLLFALGTVGALYMLQRLGHARSQQVFLIVFCASFVLVDGLALAVDPTPEEYNIHASAISSIASFALGAQNLLSQKAGIVKANTTFMTGNIQKMAEALWNAYTKRNSGGLKPAERRAAIHSSIGDAAGSRFCAHAARRRDRHLDGSGRRFLPGLRVDSLW